MKRLLILGLVLLLLTGCRQSTTVILPPDTQAPDQSTTNPTKPPVTVPATEPSTAPTEEPTEPTTEPTTEPATEPVTEPPTAPPPVYTNPPATNPPKPQKPDVYDIGSHQISGLAQSILAELNEQRIQEGLQEVSLDYSLCGVAAIRAYEFSENPSHTRPDGRDWSSVLQDYRISGDPIGENLLYGSPGYSAADIVEVWMNSTSHRKLMLHENARKVGIAIWEQDGLFYAALLITG